MIVLITEDLPDYIRGVLKRWFMEPRPNIFLGNYNTKIRKNILSFIKKSNPKIKFLIIYSTNGSQGFKMEEYGLPKKRCSHFSGLWFMFDQLLD